MKTISKPTGLRYWMNRVLEECDKVSADFSADSVHDLRVSLRRCRSMADGLIAMDPDPGWKAMKKAGKRLFQRLGELRDIQIMMEWIEKLYPIPVNVVQTPTALPEGPHNSAALETNPQTIEAVFLRDPAARALLEILARREAEQKREARAALDEFDQKQWRQWSKSLPLRASRVRPGSAVFKHLALERWTAARDLHTRALRNRSKVALHTLRIGIKRFRYIVENFLPEEHKAWSNDLKHMQDLLGEVHDLDVLWATALSCHVFPDDISRKAWQVRLHEERNKRVNAYRERMVGPDSLWQAWRAGLPQGKQIHELATRRLKLWAKVLDPDFAHSERVSRFALTLYDELRTAGLLAVPDNASARSSLLAAALLHDVGKSEGNKGHYKASLKLIKAHETPLGWKPEDLHRAAIIARFHAGALPTRSHKLLRDLLPPEQKITIQLAAILRLAKAFDASHDGHIRHIQIENVKANAKVNHQRRSHGFLRKQVAVLAADEPLIIAAEGYTAASPTAQTIAAQRYLLETVLRRPVLIKAMKNRVHRINAKRQ
jgi:CHAD domain-containing protein/HD superfamily phosphodiesterase